MPILVKVTEPKNIEITFYKVDYILYVYMPILLIMVNLYSIFFLCNMTTKKGKYLELPNTIERLGLNQKISR